MAVKGRDGLPFCEMSQEDMRALRKKLGLEEWDVESVTY